ncbi:hypothetical protein [Arthrobacter sp. NPDC058192]|uniref:hypothetical protein n=1 Tax=Arthrobacter sp. NPDC058192 TaxID=3346372 RepID=UPI0036E62EA5
MDRIEQLMKDAKPRVGEPDAVPGNDFVRSSVFSTDPNLVRLARRTPARRHAVRASAATALAAAAVVGAVVVGGNLMPQPAPGPAQTGIPAPAASASPSPEHPSPSTAAPTANPTASPTPAKTAAGALSTDGVECTIANVDQQRNDQERAIKAIPAAERAYYTVLGCADGWLAYSISDEGVRALQLDGGNAWYMIAKLRNGRFLCDVRQEWSSVFTWKFQALNNDVSQNGQRLTPQQAMDKEFETKGIPVELRPQLVGDGPAAG